MSGPESSQSRFIYDVVIIGAGLYGIQAARYYLDIHPNARLCILESDNVIGGTWSSKRIYDAFWTQTPVGMAEFSDRPMSPPPEQDQYYGFFRAHYLTKYLEAYVSDHIYNSQSIRQRIAFNVKVEGVEKTEDRLWTVTCRNGAQIKTAKLIDATGMTSIPNMPHVPGQEGFRGLLIHHKDFGQSTFLDDPKKKNIAVLGGAKSAADVVYAAAKAGKNTSWIIRKEGAGPAALLSAEGRGPYLNSNESFYTRLVAGFLPNPFNNTSWLKRFLHGTAIGRWLVKRLWDGVDIDNRKKADYKRAEGREMEFENLEPDTPVFWQNDSSGINQRPDFYSTIAKRVHVYRQSIDHLSADSITLNANGASASNSRSLPLDVLIMCTGWLPHSQLFPTPVALDLGLPTAIAESTPEETAGWETLEDGGDRNIFARFPLLRHPPAHFKTRTLYTPCRLYRAMVPVIDIEDHSIIFLGKLIVGNNFRVAEVQALWAVAYLDGNIQLQRQGMELEIGETVAWCRRRYLSKGDLGSWFYFDALDYTDMLLEQIGLRSHRSRGWLKDLFGPCKAADLKYLADEYIKAYLPL
ncbi:hypothetical protein JMJ35_009711 [Cladonia borealis]|uniref:FAD/NAD(P)-binding domain-containing protein n=1 Tax=Cladonia borealis TaxID=184061 RepID=A0AA39UXV7_9LECA|nr:hypothetical protein JMJ35_009711 [Cladonia borealis]